jgi:aspartyl-tRNA synthetase
MVSGFDRYFQIAPCFRDEDLRADRSLEFYQLDVEMSFVTQEDVFAAIEPVMHGVFEEFANGKPVTPYPFPRIPYREAMVKYGTDKPDLRIPIEMRDCTALFAQSGFKVFKGAIESGAVARAIPVKGIATKPRNFFDKLVDLCHFHRRKRACLFAMARRRGKRPAHEIPYPRRTEKN